MADRVSVAFTALADAARPEAGAETGTLVVFAGVDAGLSAGTQQLLGAAFETVRKAATIAKFKGQSGSSLDLIAPAGLAYARLLVVGTAPKKAAEPQAPGAELAALGGFVMGKLNGAERATIAFDLPVAPAAPADAVAICDRHAHVHDIRGNVGRRDRLARARGGRRARPPHRTLSAQSHRHLARPATPVLGPPHGNG